MTVPDQEFYQAIGRMEGKLDILVTGLPLLEARVRSLENWRWMLMGAACVVGTAVGFVVNILTP